MQLKIHLIQANILKILLFEPKARFSKLNVLNLPTDHFNFHIKRLVELKLIEKTDKNSYSLTIEGKEFANRFDTEKRVIEKQAKLSVVIVGAKKEKGSVKYLVQQRLKQPYFGFVGFVSGKIKWGETFLEAGTREFKEETGLEAKLLLHGIEHKMDYSKKENNLLEDKCFFIFLASSAKGDFIERFEGGKNLWLTKKEILRLPNLFGDVAKILKIIGKNKFAFFEKKYAVEVY